MDTFFYSRYNIKYKKKSPAIKQNSNFQAEHLLDAFGEQQYFRAGHLLVASGKQQYFR